MAGRPIRRAREEMRRNPGTNETFTSLVRRASRDYGIDFEAPWTLVVMRYPYPWINLQSTTEGVWAVRQLASLPSRRVGASRYACTGIGPMIEDDATSALNALVSEMYSSPERPRSMDEMLRSILDQHALISFQFPILTVGIRGMRTPILWPPMIEAFLGVR